MPNKIHTFHEKKAVEGVKTLPGATLNGAWFYFAKNDPVRLALPIKTGAI